LEPDMRFCPRCGRELVMQNLGGHARPSCLNCEYIFFGAYSLGVGGLVVKDRQILLVKRNQEPGLGRWTIPGGYAEQSETFDLAAVREVQEETGVYTRVLGLVAVRDQVRAADNNLYAVFALEPLAGVPCADGIEVAEARYFAEEELAILENLSPFTRWLAQAALAGSLTVFRSFTLPPFSGPGWVVYADVTGG